VIVTGIMSYHFLKIKLHFYGIIREAIYIAFVKTHV
jgi:hypothetical protein